MVCPRPDLNGEPTDYESGALTIELRGHNINGEKDYRDKNALSQARARGGVMKKAGTLFSALRSFRICSRRGYGGFDLAQVSAFVRGEKDEPLIRVERPEDRMRVGRAC